MKRYFIVLLTIAFIFSSVTALAEPRTVDLETMTLEELQELNASVEAAILAAQPLQEAEDVIEASDTSRKSPALIGQVVLYNGSEYYNKAETEFSVTKVIRGESANNTVKKWNRFNSKPGKNEEYILIYVKAKAVDNGGEEQASIDEYRFSVVSSNGVEYNRARAAGSTPEFTNLYPGAECEGVIPSIIAKDDQPLLVYLKDADEPLWFDLSRRKPIVIDDNTVLNPLKKGDKGDEVLAMQTALAEMGYLTVNPDGDFGKKTVDAIKKYQTDMGLNPTGAADEATLRLILTMQMPQ